jgi:hypothetical protein
MTGPTLHNAGSIGANIRDDDTSPGTSTIGMLFVFVTIGPPRVHLSLPERSVGARSLKRWTKVTVPASQWFEAAASIFAFLV